MLVIHSEKAERDGCHWVVAPRAVKAAEQSDSFGRSGNMKMIFSIDELGHRGETIFISCLSISTIILLFSLCIIHLLYTLVGLY